MLNISKIANPNYLAKIIQISNLRPHSNADRLQVTTVDFNDDKHCFICENTVPEEGIVVRKEKAFSFEAYKLKSFNFLEYESKQLDKGEVDIESAN